MNNGGVMVEKTVALPDFFRPILWSYDFGKLDPQKNIKTIVVNTINYGDLIHWRWIINAYGRPEINKVLKAIPSTEFRAPALRLAELVFRINLASNAPRSAY